MNEENIQMKVLPDEKTAKIMPTANSTSADETHGKLKPFCRFSSLSKLPRRGLLAIFGGFIAHLTYGTLYSFGNISPYITSYMRQGNETSLTYSDLIIVPSLAYVGFGAFLPLNGLIAKKVGNRWTMLIGSLLQSLGVFLSYFTVSVNLPLFTLTYGLLFGIGIGTAYIPPLAICTRWFPGRKGLVSGIVVGGFGLGTFLFSQVQTAFLNPDNVKVDEETKYFTDPDLLTRVPYLFLLLGGSYVALQVLGCFLVTDAPAGQHQNKKEEKELQSKEILTNSLPDKESATQPNIDGPKVTDPLLHATSQNNAEGNINNDGGQNSSYSQVTHVKYTAEKQDKESQAKENVEVTSLLPMQALKTVEFYILWTTFCCGQMVVGFMVSMYKAYGQEFILDDYFLTMVGAIASVFNCVGRSIWGAAMDKTSYRTCMMLLGSLLCILLFTITQTSAGGKAMYAAWIWIIFLTFSGCFALMPAATLQCFGPDNYGTIYGMVFSNATIAGPVTAVLASTMQYVLGYFGMFACLGGGCILIVIMTWFFPSKPSPTGVRRIRFAKCCVKSISTPVAV